MPALISAAARLEANFSGATGSVTRQKKRKTMSARMAIKEWVTFMSVPNVVICFISGIATTRNQVDEFGLGAPFG
jgi:hypothetical protein